MQSPGPLSWIPVPTEDLVRVISIVENARSDPFAGYTYDASNRRMRKITYDEEEDPETDTWHVWSGWQPGGHSLGGGRCLEERNRLASDNIVVRYVYGACYIDEAIQEDRNGFAEMVHERGCRRALQKAS